MFIRSGRLPRFAGLVASVATLAGSLLAVTASPAEAVLPASACTVSGPLTPRFASTMWGGPILPSYVQFQAGSGGGSYAGVAQLETPGTAAQGYLPQDRLRLFYYSAGRVTFLDSFSENNTSVDPIDGSMEAVGLDAQGLVVARVQKPGTWADNLRTNGWRYDLLGHKWLLQDSPQWTSTAPVGVSGNGTIVGTVQYGLNASARHQVVTWTGTGRGVLHLVTPLGYSADAVDQRGDIFYRDDATGTEYVRQPSGVTNTLLDYSSPADTYGVTVTSSSVGSGFGSATAASVGLGARWDVVSGSGAPISPHRLGWMVYVETAGLSGDVVGGYPGSTWPNHGTRILMRSTGKAYRMPPQFYPLDQSEPHTVINRYGQVVYTGTDGLPHLFSCPA